MQGADTALRAGDDGGARYVARLARDRRDIGRAQALRWLAFRARLAPADRRRRDSDAYDRICRHVLVEEVATGRLVACFRYMILGSGAALARSYAAQHYDLAGLAAYPGRMMEVGRFCLAPGVVDPDVLRVAWAAMARLVEAEGVAMIFGCTSFAGTEAAAYAHTFALLRDRHLGPRRWLPKAKAPRVIRFARALRQRGPDTARALAAMPPLLRSYLRMGGWVGDHAVVDGDLGTLHVFTGLEVGAIPAARVRRLRSLPVNLA